MPVMPFLAHRDELAEADELIRVHGEDAGVEAAARADSYRDMGNHLRFARWRQIERFIMLLAIDEPFGTIH